MSSKRQQGRPEFVWGRGRAGRSLAVPIWLVVALAGILMLATHAQAQAPGQETATLLARIQQLRGEVVAAERKIAAFHAASPDLSSTSVIDQQVSLALVQLAAADDEAARTSARLDALKTLNETGATDDAVAATGDAELINLLQAREALLQERAELAKTFGPAHPTMRELRTRIGLADRALSTAAAVDLDAVSAEAETHAAYHRQLQDRLAELQDEAADAATSNAELAALERGAATARLQLEIHLAQYMAPVTPVAAAEEPVIAIPPIPGRPVAASGLQSWILPLGIAGGAALALLLQRMMVQRRSYRRGFEDGAKHAAEEVELLTEWAADGAADAADQPSADRNVA